MKVTKSPLYIRQCKNECTKTQKRPSISTLDSTMSTPRRARKWLILEDKIKVIKLHESGNSARKISTMMGVGGGW